MKDAVKARREMDKAEMEATGKTGKAMSWSPLKWPGCTCAGESGVKTDGGDDNAQTSANANTNANANADDNNDALQEDSLSSLVNYVRPKPPGNLGDLPLATYTYIFKESLLSSMLYYFMYEHYDPRVDCVGRDPAEDLMESIAEGGASHTFPSPPSHDKENKKLKEMQESLYSDFGSTHEVISDMLNYKRNAGMVGKAPLFERIPITSRYEEIAIEGTKGRVSKAGALLTRDRGKEDVFADGGSIAQSVEEKVSFATTRDPRLPVENMHEQQQLSPLLPCWQREVQGDKKQEDTLVKSHLPDSVCDGGEPGGDKILPHNTLRHNSHDKHRLQHLYLLPTTVFEGDQGHFDLTISCNMKIVSLEPVLIRQLLAAPPPGSEAIDFSHHSIYDFRRSNTKPLTLQQQEQLKLTNTLSPDKRTLIQDMKVSAFKKDEYNSLYREKSNRTKEYHFSRPDPYECLKQPRERNAYLIACENDYSPLKRHGDDILIKVNDTAKDFKKQQELLMREVRLKYRRKHFPDAPEESLEEKGRVDSSTPLSRSPFQSSPSSSPSSPSRLSPISRKPSSTATSRKK